MVAILLMLSAHAQTGTAMKKADVFNFSLPSLQWRLSSFQEAISPHKILKVANTHLY